MPSSAWTVRDDRIAVLQLIVGCVHDVLAFASDYVASLYRRSKGTSLNRVPYITRINFYLIAQILSSISRHKAYNMQNTCGFLKIQAHQTGFKPYSLSRSTGCKTLA